MPELPPSPEYMTWAELERLPEEYAAGIELWDGRVVLVRRGPAEHQAYSALMWRMLLGQAEQATRTDPEQCWTASLDTNVFLSGKSDFLTPDFLVHRCLPEFSDIWAQDTVLVGEVLSPGNTVSEIEAKKNRYAAAGIPWYWEVELPHDPRHIAEIRAYVLQARPGEIPEGVTLLRPANYLPTSEWKPEETTKIHTEFPFPQFFLGRNTILKHCCTRM